MGLLERIYYFHEELKNSRFPNATSLINQFEVSSATAHRDIAYLRDRLLAPLAFDQLKNGFYYTREGFGLPFEKSPKLVFLLGMLSKIADEAGLGSLEEVQALEERLSQLVFPEYSRLVDAIHCEWVEVETIRPEIFQTIIEATVGKKILCVRYRSAVGRITERELEPLRLVSYQGRWYLLAFCRLRLDIRLFHLARLEDAVLGKKSFEQRSDVHDNYDSYLNSAFGIFKGEVIFHATIRFRSTAAELVRHQRWHRDQTVEETEDGILLHLPVNDDRELVMKILQYGSMAEVVAPPGLRRRLFDEAKGIAALYSENDSSAADA